MDNTLRSACFTGHRIIRTQDRERLCVSLKEEIRALVSRGITNFISGGALGFDMLAAEAVIDMREKELAGITLELILPCENQPDKWTPQERERYRYILSNADKISYVSREYTPTCMKERNRAMVDASEHCIGYIYKNFGGAAYTVKYADEKGKGITLI